MYIPMKSYEWGNQALFEWYNGTMNGVFSASRHFKGFGILGSGEFLPKLGALPLVWYLWDPPRIWLLVLVWYQYDDDDDDNDEDDDDDEEDDDMMIVIIPSPVHIRHPHGMVPNMFSNSLLNHCFWGGIFSMHIILMYL